MGGSAMTEPAGVDLRALRRELSERARALGFDALGVASIDIPEDERHLLKWLEDGCPGGMPYIPTPRCHAQPAAAAAPRHRARRERAHGLLAGRGARRTGGAG